MTQLSPQNINTLFERLKELAQLETDWDSYDAKPIPPIAFVTALEILFKERVPVPDFIAPISNGGLQLEWSDEQICLEIEVFANDNLTYFFYEKKNGKAGTYKKQVALVEVLNLLEKHLNKK